MPVKNVVIGQKVSSALQQRARELRRTMTPAETILWQELRHNRLNSLQFRRQQIIDSYIVDFYCHAKALVVEVDGDVHDLQKEYDKEREMHLIARGFHVLRFTNEEVHNTTSAVLRRIREACSKI
jgi:very-short-patch-repair endonuclease